MNGVQRPSVGVSVIVSSPAVTACLSARACSQVSGRANSTISWLLGCPPSGASATALTSVRRVGPLRRLGGYGPWVWAAELRTPAHPPMRQRDRHPAKVRTLSARLSSSPPTLSQQDIASPSDLHARLESRQRTGMLSDFVPRSKAHRSRSPDDIVAASDDIVA